MSLSSWCAHRKLWDNQWWEILHLMVTMHLGLFLCFLIAIFLSCTFQIQWWSQNKESLRITGLKFCSIYLRNIQQIRIWIIFISLWIITSWDISIRYLWIYPINHMLQFITQILGYLCHSFKYLWRTYFFLLKLDMFNIWDIFKSF